GGARGARPSRPGGGEGRAGSGSPAHRRPVSSLTVPSRLPAQRRAVEAVALATPVVARLAEAFGAAGHDLHLVGGPVRDALTGRGVHDLDFTTDARPDAIEAVLRALTRTTWDIGRAFGTLGAQFPGGDEPVTVEVTT